MAKVTVKRTEPVVPKIEKVTLELTGNEAAFLKLLVGNTSGSNREASTIFNALDNALPGNYSLTGSAFRVNREEVAKAATAYKI